MRSLRPVPYGSLLASNLRAARGAANLSQSDVGERMQSLGFTAWLRSTVSLAEQGKRRVSAEELLGLALVLETSMVRLAEPPEERPWIELPCGETVYRTTVRGAGEVQWTGNTPHFMRNQGTGWGMAEDTAGALGTARTLAARTPGLEGRGTHLPRPDDQPVIAGIITSGRGVLVTRRRDRTPPWGFVTGWNEPGESPADTIVREAKEEAGLRVTVGERLGERDHPDTGRHMIYYAARPTHGTEVHVGDEAELLDVRWASVAEAERLLPGMFGPVREHLAREIGEG